MGSMQYYFRQPGTGSVAKQDALTKQASMDKEAQFIAGAFAAMSLYNALRHHAPGLAKAIYHRNWGNAIRNVGGLAGDAIWAIPGFGVAGKALGAVGKGAKFLRAAGAGSKLLRAVPGAVRAGRAVGSVGAAAERGGAAMLGTHGRLLSKLPSFITGEAAAGATNTSLANRAAQAGVSKFNPKAWAPHMFKSPGAQQFMFSTGIDTATGHLANAVGGRQIMPGTMHPVYHHGNMINNNPNNFITGMKNVFPNNGPMQYTS